MNARRLVFGMDVGGTRTKYGLIDLNQREIVAQRVLPTQTTGREAFIRAARQALEEPCQEIGVPRTEVMASGVGVPGYVDENGISMVWETLAFMEVAGFEHALAEGLELPLRTENDARVVALGEDHFGGYTALTGRPRRLLSLTLGTGLGVSLVVEGCLQEASSITHLAGHIPIRLGAGPCFCGFSGCLESLVGASGLVRNFRQASGTAGHSPPEAQQIFQLAHAGNAAARQAVRQVCEDLVTGLNAYIFLYAPDGIVLGGGLALGLADWLPSIRAGLFAQPHKGYRVTVLTSRLRELAGLYGAASLWDEGRGAGN
jgi:glucokinase